MKKIEAIIRKTKFEDVKDALLEADIEWFSYYDVIIKAIASCGYDGKQALGKPGVLRKRADGRCRQTKNEIGRAHV